MRIRFNRHEAGNIPQWEEIDPADRNIWQKIAAKTGGIVRPSSAITALGLGLDFKGSYDISRGHHLRGAIEYGLGRVCDLGDGFVAEHTGTLCPAGRVEDVVADKLAMAAVLPNIGKEKTIPTITGSLIAGQEAVVGIAGLNAIVRGHTEVVQPNIKLKGSTTVKWGSFALYEGSKIAKDYGHETTARWMHRAATIAALGGAAWSFTAWPEYSRKHVRTIKILNRLYSDRISLKRS